MARTTLFVRKLTDPLSSSLTRREGPHGMLGGALQARTQSLLSQTPFRAGAECIWLLVGHNLQALGTQWFGSRCASLPRLTEGAGAQSTILPLHTLISQQSRHTPLHKHFGLWQHTGIMPMQMIKALPPTAQSCTRSMRSSPDQQADHRSRIVRKAGRPPAGRADR